LLGSIGEYGKFDQYRSARKSGYAAIGGAAGEPMYGMYQFGSEEF